MAYTGLVNVPVTACSAKQRLQQEQQHDQANTNTNTNPNVNTNVNTNTKYIILASQSPMAVCWANNN